VDSPIRVTSAGNATLFHGVPDWVYEEEVFASDYALWWSPDSAKVAFLVFDETSVPEYVFPVYNPGWSNAAVKPYTSDVRMRYPKPGYPNPRVSAHVFDLSRYLTDRLLDPTSATLELDWAGRLPDNDTVLTEVVWLDNVDLLIKEVSRNADRGSVVLFDLASASPSGKIVRTLGRDGEEGDDGWIEARQSVVPLPVSLLHAGVSGYLDIVPTKEGWNHIALFSPVDSTTPRWLTAGEWEVTGNILAIAPSSHLVYFQAANPSSTQRHIYSVPLPDLDKLATDAAATPPAPLTDVSQPGYFSADFSPNAGFYLLSYDGPAIPWQRVEATSDEKISFVLTDNTKLNETWNAFEMPIVQHSIIESDGYGACIHGLVAGHLPAMLTLLQS
jgi:dipeptidyl aminopeptidase